MDLESYYENLRNQMRELGKKLAGNLGRCPRCGSTNLRGDVAEHYEEGKTIEFKAVVLCRNCGK
jgi:uncharacterized protein with PIN domain